MSYIPGRSFSIDQPLTDPREDADRFYELLKSAAPDKGASDGTGQGVAGVNPSPYPDPPDREAGTVEALWGEEPSKKSNNAQFHSNAVWDAFRRGREEFLKRDFANYEPSAAAAVRELSQNFDHFKSGDHESSKPFTNDHSKLRPEVVETVLDKTKRLLNRA